MSHCPDYRINTSLLLSIKHQKPRLTVYRIRKGIWFSWTWDPVVDNKKWRGAWYVTPANSALLLENDHPRQKNCRGQPHHLTPIHDCTNECTLTSLSPPPNALLMCTEHRSGGLQFHRFSWVSDLDDADDNATFGYNWGNLTDTHQQRAHTVGLMVGKQGNALSTCPRT